MNSLGGALTRGRLLVLVVVAVLALGATGLWLDPGPDPPAREAAPEMGVARVPPRLQGRVVDTIGVVSFNVWHKLRRSGVRQDWARITGDEDVDLIGWQESKSEAWTAQARSYRARGWGTWHWPDEDGPRPVAVSWRTSTFRLEHVAITQAHRGGSPSETQAPFPARWIAQVSLRHRASGLRVTLLNTHVNQTIETGHGWQDNLNAEMARVHYRTLAQAYAEAPGDVVIGTGDYNFDYADDSAYRPRGGISRTVGRAAQSSYEALGLGGVEPTQRTRWIDYVWLADRSVRRRDGSGVAQFVQHRSLGGFRSDHRPLLARVRLYAAR
ncbi:exonuclease/endonuclease/phosphatase family protein [Nocardioides pacificus]